jgi:hypothetical protein
MARNKCLLCEEADSQFHLFLKSPENQWWREEFLNRKLLHVKDEIGVRFIFTVKNATDQRNSGNLGYKNKYKWQNQGKKEKLKQDRVPDLYSTRDPWVINKLDEKINIKIIINSKGKPKSLAI